MYQSSLYKTKYVLATAAKFSLTVEAFPVAAASGSAADERSFGAGGGSLLWFGRGLRGRRSRFPVLSLHLGGPTKGPESDVPAHRHQARKSNRNGNARLKRWAGLCFFFVFKKDFLAQRTRGCTTWLWPPVAAQTSRWARSTSSSSVNSSMQRESQVRSPFVTSLGPVLHDETHVRSCHRFRVRSPSVKKWQKWCCSGPTRAVP